MLAAAQSAVRLEELRAGGADDEQRRVARRVGEVLEELEQGRLGPVDVLDHDHERPVAGETLEDAADRPEDLLLRAPARRTGRSRTPPGP